MPFPEQTPRAFTRENILALNPGQMGVYGLFKAGQWIYVGSGDIRARLLDHLDGDNPCITRAQPTLWVDWVTVNYLGVEKLLIAEIQPACNQRAG